MKLIGALLLVSGVLSAQAPQPQNAAQPSGDNAALLVSSGTPIYRVTVTERTAKAVNYKHRSGATKIDFRGTELLPKARGEAKVESKQGYIEIEVEFDGLQPASTQGAEYLTYVLWAITPEGRTANLGEDPSERNEEQAERNHRTAGVRVSGHSRTLLRRHAAERPNCDGKRRYAQTRRARSRRSTPSTNCCSAASISVWRTRWR